MNTDDSFFDNIDELIEKFENIELFKSLTYLFNKKEYFKSIADKDIKRNNLKIRKLILKDLKKINSQSELNKYNFYIKESPIDSITISLREKYKNKKSIKIWISQPEFSSIISSNDKKPNFSYFIEIDQFFNINGVEWIKKIIFNQVIIDIDFRKKGEISLLSNITASRLENSKEFKFMDSKNPNAYKKYLLEIINKINEVDYDMLLNYLFFNKEIDNEHFELLYDVNIHELDFLSLFKTDLNTIMIPFLSIDKNKGLKNEYR